MHDFSTATTVLSILYSKRDSFWEGLKSPSEGHAFQKKQAFPASSPFSPSGSHRRAEKLMCIFADELIKVICRTVSVSPYCILPLSYPTPKSGICTEGPSGPPAAVSTALINMYEHKYKGSEIGWSNPRLMS